ncbi:hypothetical protein [Paraflavitalea sp. CAU 1676]|uniref:hypothetical protein n=1 Tax=Paraflavitalea sp. CAU 1676 TaxID=3032598 RepID=UPI0023DBC303|nr:hypothetical protein [Paraflavitalea sp. CAU 1676]MDF2192482.1 hypothetical protein [Paraflavitalea sp. CAU 1676]
MNNKPYKTPVWNILAIIAIKIVFTIWWGYSVIDLWSNDSGGDYNEEEFYQLFLKWQLISLATIIFLLAAEAFAYWRIRFREIKRPLAHIHIASLFLVLVLIPVIGTLLTIGNARFGVYEPDDAAVEFARYKQFIMWGSLIIGHICFVVVLITARKTRSKPIDVPLSEKAEILSDYSESI